MRASYRARRFIVVGVLLAFALPGLCYGQATVLILAQGNPNDPQLSKVVENAADVQLGKNPIISVTTAENVSVGSSGEIAPPSGTVADFLLWINYIKSDKDVRLQLSLRDSKSGTIIASNAASVPFDLSFDFGVSDAVARLMATPGVAEALKRAADAAKTAAARAAKATSQKPGTTGKNAKAASPPAAAAGAVTPPATPGPSGRVTQIPGKSPQAPPEHWGFAFGGSGAPLILVGNASNYFRYGAAANLHLGLHFPFERVDFETGLLAGARALFPAVGITAGLVYSALVGPQIRLGTPSRYPVAMGLQASGGAAFIIANIANVGVEAKTDLFAAGAITAHVRLSRRFYFGTELGMIVIFEERYPIIAIEPSLTFGFSP